MQIASIILSAGKGTRMRSDFPKTFHKIAGKKMIDWVIDVNKSINPDKIIIVGANREHYSTYIDDYDIIIQDKPLGTGDAVKKAKNHFSKFNGVILVCYGDTPFLTKNTLKKLVKSISIKKNNIALTYFNKDEKNSYGKIILSENKKPIKVLEDKKSISNIKLCNGGLIAFQSKDLYKLLSKLELNSLSNEYFLTDLVEIAAKKSMKIDLIKIDENEILGVNDKIELYKAEKIAQKKIRDSFFSIGVTLLDPETIYFAHDTIIEKDVIIHPNVVIGNNVKIKKNSEIYSFTHLAECIINENVKIGPFARIRGFSDIATNSKIGNYVEIKKTKLGKNVKINHLSYIGDSNVGSNSNIGAGSITCNFDGYKKHKTVIGKDTFIGSNSTLIAPIKIGDNATVGAGSVITENIPKNSLSIARKRQVNKQNKSIKKNN